MNRSLPQIQTPEIIALAEFRPSGEAVLLVGFPGQPDVPYTRDQVDQLEEKIAAFKRQCMFEDGRPDTRLRTHREAL